MAKIRSIRLPSPGEMATGYMNSNFHHKNFKQQLVSRARIEDEETQRARKLLVDHNSPAELARLSHPLDIPLPKFRKKNKSQSQDNKDEEAEEDKKIYGTIPRSWQKRNLVTSVKECEDPSVLEERQNLVKHYTPAELAQLSSITDLPVPSRITNIFSSNKRNKKRRYLL